MTSTLSNHPKCPCDECWCTSCVNNSNKVKSEIESRKQKFIESENHNKMVKDMQAKKDKLKPIADGIRKKHHIVYRFKRTAISRGLDGYESPFIENLYYGVFSSYDNVEKFIVSQKIKDDIVVVKSNKVPDEEIIELDKCFETVTHQQHYGC